MGTCPKCRSTYADTVNKCPHDGETLLPDAACQNFDQDLQVGDVVGEYRVQKKIGEGGFGRVYSAIHPVIGKRAAIKVLNREYSSNPSVVSRFISEARAVNQIRHRNIIDIFSFGTLPGGLQYFVMELLDGMTLDAFLKDNGRLHPEDAMPILRALGRALDAAHGAGIAHRDMKPENVFLSFDEEGTCYPKLLDFGIAKLMSDPGVSHKTRTGAAMGTPLYMSPEQCRGLGVDHRTDIYAFGVMTHEMLTGRLPFAAESMMDLMLKHTTAPPPPMSSFNQQLPASLDAPVQQMLAKEPVARPQTLSAAVEQLADAARAAGYNIAVKKSLGSRSLLNKSRAPGTKNPTPLNGVVTVTRDGQSTVPPTLMNGLPPALAPAGGAEARPKKSKAMTLVAAALVLGVGVTLAVSQRSGADPGSPVGPASSQLATTASAPTALPTSSVDATASAAPIASAAPLAGVDPSAAPTKKVPATNVATAPKVHQKAPPATSKPPPKPTAKPPRKPPPSPVVPDDLASPF